jgi:hypothetical protein
MSAHAPSRISHREGAGASQARARWPGLAASRSGPPPSRSGRSDDAARTSPGTARPRRPSAAAAQTASANSAAVEREESPTGATTRGPVCQIRWLPRGRGSCFAAVTTDAYGVERTLATSPHVDWRASTPPEQCLQAQAALRNLAKTLRDNGWRPMRAKGKDFNEPQWYARRFRHPEAPAPDDSPVVSARGASAP